ncbi:TPA: hypothetical protein ACWO8G_001669 [Salmonella enterica subsp. enterica serovar Muenchen]
MKSKIKSLLVAGYNHGWLSISFVDFWFKNLDLSSHYLRQWRLNAIRRAVA